MPVDTLDMDMCGEAVVGLIPLCSDYARSESGLKHLGTRTVEGMDLHQAIIVDIAHHIVAGYGTAAWREFEIGTIARCRQTVYFLRIHRLGRSGRRSRGLLLGLFAKVKLLGENSRSLARLCGGFPERFYQEFAKHDFLSRYLAAQFIAITNLIYAL